MAGPNTNFDQLSALVIDYFGPKHRDLVFNKAPALGSFMRQPGASRPRGGDMIRQTFTYATTNDGGYLDYGTLPSGAEDKFSASQWAWKLYQQHFTISVPEIRRSSGKEAIFSMMDRGTAASMSAIKDAIETDIFYFSDGASSEYYGDSDLDHVHGLVGMLGDGTFPDAATIGSIPKTNTFWQGNVVDDGGATTEAHINQLWWACVDGGDTPTMWFCSNTKADVIDDLAHPAGASYERFMRQPGGGGSNEFQFLPTVGWLKGAPVVADRHVNVDHIFALKMDDFDFVIHRDENFRFDGFQKPHDKNVRVGRWYFMGNLTCLDPRRSGMTKNVGP